MGGLHALALSPCRWANPEDGLLCLDTDTRQGGHVIRENSDQDRIEIHARILAMVDQLSIERAVIDKGNDGADRMACTAGMRHRILS